MRKNRAPPSKFVFTRKAIAALETPDPFRWRKGRELTDANTPGLKLFLSPSGRTFWWWRYTFEGRKRCIRLGEYPAMSLAKARQLAWKHRETLDTGTDPQDERKRVQREQLRFAEYWDETYFPYISQRIKSSKSRQGHYKNLLCPTWGNKRLRDITTADVQAVLDRALDGRSPSTVNRIRATIHHALGHACKRLGLVPENVAARTVRLREPPNRQRYLSDAETKRFWAALAQCRPQSAAILKCLILSGCRSGEVFAWRWQDIRWDQNAILIPNSKSGKARHVPLNDLVIGILREQRERVNGSPWCWPAPRKQTGHQVSVRGTWFRALELAGISADTIRAHDLRHTAASLLIASGATLYEVQHILGHSTPIMTQRYAHLANDALQRASARLSDRIADITGE